ncbi:MAG: hypothetical protein MUC30_02980 [Bacteroidales bacterium]|nr:hypothetical protein [Bacteroidales bacterium]
MGTILYVLVPIPTCDSHDRHCRHATVIVAGSSLFAPAFPGPVDVSLAAYCRFPVPVLHLSSFFALRFYVALNEARGHEPLRPDIPRRDSCCHARIIFILSSPVWMA